MIENKEHDYEYAVLIGIINQEQSAQQVSDYMDELAFLTLTAGGEVKKRFTQKLNTPHPKDLYRKRKNGRRACLCQNT